MNLFFGSDNISKRIYTVLQKGIIKNINNKNLNKNEKME